jgi:hypothetical protein
VRVFRQKFTLEDAIELHAFVPLEASRRVINGISLGCSLLLPVHTVNCVQTLKAHPTVDSQVSSIEADVLSGKMTAGQGADELIRSFAVQNTSSTGSQDKQ